MKSKRKVALLLGAALALAGCGEQPGTDDNAAAEPADTGGAVEKTVELTQELEAKLVVADRLDGQTDHVVANCPGCGLTMEGSDEHALHVGEYSLHFCSGSCLRSFSKDPHSSLVALALPEDEEQPAQDPAP